MPFLGCFSIIDPSFLGSMARCCVKKTKTCEFCVTGCTFGGGLWYNPFYSIVRTCATPSCAALPIRSKGGGSQRTQKRTPHFYGRRKTGRRGGRAGRRVPAP